uniref:Uncharacterized protein n=1 Tax=Cacopsylla melanoneura TaxID=428564 RepID=A0A8D9BGL6_9HEMI
MLESSSGLLLSSSFFCFFMLFFSHVSSSTPSFLPHSLNFLSFFIPAFIHPSLPTLLNTKSSILPASLSHSTQEFLFPFLVCLSLFYCFYCFYCSSTTFPFSCHFLL